MHCHTFFEMPDYRLFFSNPIFAIRLRIFAEKDSLASISPVPELLIHSLGLSYFSSRFNCRQCTASSAMPLSLILPRSPSFGCVSSVLSCHQGGAARTTPLALSLILLHSPSFGCVSSVLSCHQDGAASTTPLALSLVLLHSPGLGCFSSVLSCHQGSAASATPLALSLILLRSPSFGYFSSVLNRHQGGTVRTKSLSLILLRSPNLVTLVVFSIATRVALREPRH